MKHSGLELKELAAQSLEEMFEACSGALTEDDGMHLEMLAAYVPPPEGAASWVGDLPGTPPVRERDDGIQTGHWERPAIVGPDTRAGFHGKVPEKNGKSREDILRKLHWFGVRLVLSPVDEADWPEVVEGLQAELWAVPYFFNPRVFWQKSANRVQIQYETRWPRIDGLADDAYEEVFDACGRASTKMEGRHLEVVGLYLLSPVRPASPGAGLAGTSPVSEWYGDPFGEDWEWPGIVASNMYFGFQGKVPEKNQKRREDTPAKLKWFHVCLASSPVYETDWAEVVPGLQRELEARPHLRSPHVFWEKDADRVVVEYETQWPRIEGLARDSLEELADVYYAAFQKFESHHLEVLDVYPLPPE